MLYNMKSLGSFAYDSSPNLAKRVIPTMATKPTGRIKMKDFLKRGVMPNKMSAM